MANLTEANNWDAGVYRIETADPVLGGESGPANAGAKNLANRTHWLRNQLAGLSASGSWVEVVKTSTGPWTAPAGVTKVIILEMVGAGAGGSGAYYEINSGYTGGGGGEGARIENVVLTVVPTTEYTLTVGAAGAAGTTHGDGDAFAADGVVAGTFGTDGGDTSFGALLTAPGGKAAGDPNNTFGADYVCAPGVGGTVTFGGVTFTGESGDPGGIDGVTEAGRGGGRLGGKAWILRTGAATWVASYATPGYGCGGSGGEYTGGKTPQAGGPGLIRFAYPLVSLSGLPSAI